MSKHNIVQVSSRQIFDKIKKQLEHNKIIIVSDNYNDLDVNINDFNKLVLDESDLNKHDYDKLDKYDCDLEFFPEITNFIITDTTDLYDKIGLSMVDDEYLNEIELYIRVVNTNI